MCVSALSSFSRFFYYNGDKCVCVCVCVRQFPVNGQYLTVGCLFARGGQSLGAQGEETEARQRTGCEEGRRRCFGV